MIRPFQTAQVDDFGFLFTVPANLAPTGLGFEAFGGGGGAGKNLGGGGGGAGK